MTVQVGKNSDGQNVFLTNRHPTKISLSASASEAFFYELPGPGRASKPAQLAEHHHRSGLEAAKAVLHELPRSRRPQGPHQVPEPVLNDDSFTLESPC